MNEVVVVGYGTSKKKELNRCYFSSSDQRYFRVG
jgi:hypothetical protein